VNIELICLQVVRRRTSASRRGFPVGRYARAWSVFSFLTSKANVLLNTIWPVQTHWCSGVPPLALSRAGVKSRESKADRAAREEVDGEIGEIKILKKPACPQKPDGRKCNLCLHKDDAPDPCALARGVREFMAWGKPHNPETGKSHGQYCYYCMKYYTSRIKLAMGISMAEYENWLGEDQDRLKKHQCIITVVVGVLAESGGPSKKHLDWGSIEGKALQVTHSQETIIKKPGYSHVEWGYYTAKYGSLYTNGLTNHGHQEYTHDRVALKFTFIERTSARTFQRGDGPSTDRVRNR